MLTNIAVRLNSLIITFLNLSMQVQALGLATEYRNPDGDFPPIHWNYFNQHQPRTNNNVEGWHSRMKKVISKPHPNIFAWIEYIQREEAVTKAKIQSFRSGATARPRRRRMKEKEKRIQTLFDRFNAGNATLNEYLEAIKHLTGL